MDDKIAYILRIMRWKVLHFIMCVCYFTWFFTMIMPDRYNYKCLGMLKSYEEGNFEIYEHYELNKYGSKIVYVGFDNKTYTKYFGERLFDQWTVRHIKNNKMRYAYEYKWYTLHTWYFLMAIVFSVIVVKGHDQKSYYVDRLRLIRNEEFNRRRDEKMKKEKKKKDELKIKMNQERII